LKSVITVSNIHIPKCIYKLQEYISLAITSAIQKRPA